MNFKDYLLEMNYTDSSIDRYIQSIGYVKAWCESNRIGFDQLRYAEVERYMASLRVKSIQPQTINNRLIALSIYMDFQESVGLRMHNPIVKLRVKDIRKPVLKTLTLVEMERILHELPSDIIVQVRDKLIYSIMIYQAANTTSLKALKVSDIDLEKGEILLTKTKRQNARTLVVSPVQYALFKRYLEFHQLNYSTESLFIGNIHNTLTRVKEILLKINPSFLNVRQLRTSRIVDWLARHNIRQVQYFAGHRRITSTLAYRQHSVEELKEELKDLHPLAF